MKKILLFTFLLLTFSIRNYCQAQSINILQVRDSLFSNKCGHGLPFYNDSYVDFMATGFSNTDTLQVKFYHGDGTFDIYDHPVAWMFNDRDQRPINHLYLNYGSYDVTVIISGPGGVSDTLVCFDDVIVDTNCVEVDAVVYVDQNSNCIYDSSEVIINGSIDVYNGASHHGLFYGEVDEGYFYTFTLQVTPGYALTCPAGGITSFTAQNDTTLWFAVECQNNIYDFSVNHYTLRLNPANTVYYRIFTRNDYCSGPDGTYSLIMSPELDYVTSFPAPLSVVGDTITWPYSNITFGNTAGAMVYANLVPGVQMGDTICTEGFTELFPGDVNPPNNVQTFCGWVGMAYDPNMKTVSPAGTGTSGFIQPGTDLLYTVHFQNTGNDTAYSVVIYDTLDADLDIFNFRVVSSSHTYQVFFLSQNVIEFRFPGILLPDSNINEPESHGYISYEVLAAAVPGTEFTNTAHIYFDSNPAIVTNTTLNTIAFPSGIAETANSSFSLYPNPAGLEAKLLMQSAGQYNVSLFNISGKVMDSFSFHGNERLIDLSGYNQGVYIGKISSEELTQTFRLVVLH
jgi:uncharacterized repeat protein (TIGR01451 family)